MSRAAPIPLQGSLLLPLAAALCSALLVGGAWYADGPVINEFMASNGTTLADEDGDYSDWIELYNPTGDVVDLSGWSLTDDPDEPEKWVLGEGALQPDDYLVVFASGKDRQPGSSWWNSVVQLGDVFRYFPGADSTPSGWQQPDYDDADWAEGPSALGYERGSGGADIRTEVSEGLLTLYTRITFRVDDPAEVRRALLHVDYDDGFVAYVNGAEVARSNVDPAQPSHDTPASGLREAEMYQGGAPERFEIADPPGVFVAGTNVLAIEVHNANETSSDLTLIPFLSLETSTPPADPRGVAPELRPLGGGEYHTNFSLSREGEYLALVAPDGTVASEFAPYPEQQRDVSYGAGNGGMAFFTTSTPGEPNAPAAGGVVDAPTFSAEHGIYEEPFSLFLFPETDGSVIRYTLDGSQPTETRGKTYIGPLRIESTTVVRAAAFKDGARRSDVVTRTYLFLDDVIRQSPTGSAPPGWPRSWGGNAVDYGMDPNVVDGNEGNVLAALSAIPSFSFALELDSLFDAQRGIYANALSYGRAWERPASVELIYPPEFPRTGAVADLHGPRSGFQVDAGLRIRGGWSRNEENPKHAFRIFFRSDYGPPVLAYPLFGREGVDEFDKFDLRTAQNYSWSFTGDHRNTFVRDVFARDIQRDMGVPYTRSHYYHLYVNGQYWGLFQTQERADHWHGASYLGGDADDYDVVKSAGLDGGYEMEMTSGTVDAWRALYQGANRVAAATPEEADSLFMMLQGLNPDGTRNPAYPVLLDADNLIQYMLVIFWTGNPDAPITPFMGTNNFFGYRDRTGERGFVWFAHDSEHTLLPENGGYLDRTGPFPAGDEFRFSNPQWIHQQLMGSPEYRLRFADLARRHLFHGGVLTTEPSVSRWDARAAEVSPVIIAESARWGDAKREPPRSVGDWQAEIDRVRNAVLPPRRDVILDQLMRTRRYVNGQSANETISAPLYPAVEAPEFDRWGGEVPAGFELSMSGEHQDSILFRIDGGDPRQVGGGIAPEARRYEGPVTLSGRTLVRARVRTGDGRWSALSQAEFFAGAADPTSSALVISEIHYHPPAPTEAELAAGFDDANDFEFLEIHNPSQVRVSLDGLTFTEGVSFAFGPGSIGADERVVVVSNEDAFRARYGDEVPMAGTFTSGRLSNGGERVTLSGPGGAAIFSVAYGDGGRWPSRADGAGSSLVLRPDAEDPRAPESWLPSAIYGGTPGLPDAFEESEVVVNEVLSHTDPPEMDAIEIYNTSDAGVDLSGWYLSDGADFRKYGIPAGTVLEAGGYLVFDESDFNASGTERDFALSSLGEEVWLVEADAGGEPLRFVDVVTFGAARNGETFGRMEDGTLLPQIRPTLGGPNSGPRPGTVVIREIMYHPPGNNENLEYIGLLNAGTEPEDLTSWTLRRGVDFVFPDGRQLAAGDSLLVVAFDPDAEPDKAATFRQAYGWDEPVPLVGPWDGRLANDGEVIELRRPDEPPADDPEFIPETLEERVDYRDVPPWPDAADGGGASLFRVDVEASSYYASSWGALVRPFALYEDHQEPDPPPVPGSGFVLSDLYPNPARDRIRGTLTVGEAQHVRVALYDILGREVRTVYDAQVSAETLEPIVIDGGGLASGLYLVRVTGRTFSVTRAITFVR